MQNLKVQNRLDFKVKTLKYKSEERNFDFCPTTIFKTHKDLVNVTKCQGRSLSNLCKDFSPRLSKRNTMIPFQCIINSFSIFSMVSPHRLPHLASMKFPKDSATLPVCFFIVHFKMKCRIFSWPWQTSQSLKVISMWCQSP